MYFFTTTGVFTRLLLMGLNRAIIYRQTHKGVIMKRMLFIALAIFSVNVFADSLFVDSARLRNCGGEVELRESRENLHLQFNDVRNCSNLDIQDVSYDRRSGRRTVRTIRSYKLNSNHARPPYRANFTLSNRMWAELEHDGELHLYIHSNSKRTEDHVELRLYPRGRRENYRRYDR